ncbi:dolichyl-diphosphooligosaccharide--protein glycosyltransferase subunit MAGT1-like [Rhynchonycteris naso]
MAEWWWLWCVSLPVVSKLSMSNDVFYYFVLETPRNYSITVMCTAVQKFRSCVICKHAAEEFQILVYKNGIIILMLDDMTI